MPKPDFFHKSSRSTADDLLQTEATYEQRLASYLLLTHFSFFEAFVSDIIDEMIEFHGGPENFLSRNESRAKQFMAPNPPHIAKLKRKLQDSEKASWRDRYRSYARKLAGEGFRFPGELFGPFGLKNFIAKVKKMKAWEIPSVLVDALRLELSDAEIEAYHKTRQIRNAIAHGDTVSLSMRDAVGMNKSLRELAIKISDHFTENFFVIEKYAP
ncbi:MAG TPA: HEPN domain-containing protein [Candidatus Sulfotelmatobacter sp.]